MKSMEELNKELEIMRAISDRNLKARDLLNDGKYEEIKPLLEENIKLKADTPATYRYLAIVYEEQGDKANAIRVLKAGLENVSPNNESHYKYLQDELKRLE